MADTFELETRVAQLEAMVAELTANQQLDVGGADIPVSVFPVQVFGGSGGGGSGGGGSASDEVTVVTGGTVQFIPATSPSETPKLRLTFTCKKILVASSEDAQSIQRDLTLATDQIVTGATYHLSGANKNKFTLTKKNVILFGSGTAAEDANPVFTARPHSSLMD